MSARDRAGHWRWVGGLVLAALCLLAGCDRPQRDVVQGYVEGEFVYVASPLAGALESLFVQRGSQINAGDPLFALECGAETAAQAQAAKRLEEGRARLDDAKKASVRRRSKPSKRS
jgi:HlyD family secretion protein